MTVALNLYALIRVTDSVNGLDQSEKQINNGAKGLVKHFEEDSEKKR